MGSEVWSRRRRRRSAGEKGRPAGARWAMPNDLAAAWLHARILPLQRRVHRICDLSGPRDPTRLSTCRIKMEDLCRRLRDITNGHLPEPYHFGLMYLTRREKPRWVCADCIPDFLPIRLFF